MHPGTIRTATLADAPALSELLACARTDVLPLTESHVATMLSRGHVIVLDLGGGRIGGAAHVRIEQIGSVRHAIVRSLAVHPALAGCGVGQRLIRALIALCDTHGTPLRPFRDVDLPSRQQLRAAHVGLARHAVLWTLLALSLPRVIASAGADTVSTFVLVWSALALVLHTRPPRIPRAMVWGRRRMRSRAWLDALVRRFGELAPSAHGRHELPLAYFSRASRSDRLSYSTHSPLTRT